VCESAGTIAAVSNRLLPDDPRAAPATGPSAGPVVVAAALAGATVVVDLDGAARVRSADAEVLARFGRDGWEPSWAALETGATSTREALVDLWDLVGGDEGSLRSAARAVPLDPDLGPLVDGLRAVGARVVVVADGFGFDAADACAGLDVEVLANDVDFARRYLSFPHGSLSCPCTTCAVCKQAPVREAHDRGALAVLVGGRVNDRKAVLLADVVLARGPLARWCEANEVPYTPFRGLADVHRALLGGHGGRARADA